MTGGSKLTTAADRRKQNKDAGFSLLELLIAVIILAIIVIPLLNLFLSSNRLNIQTDLACHHGSAGHHGGLEGLRYGGDKGAV